MQLELAIGKGTAQIELHVSAPVRLAIHLAFEEAVRAAAVLLGAVEPEVGVAHQFFAGVAVAGRHGNADRGADHDLIAVDLIGRAQSLNQAGGEIVCLIGRDVGGQDDRELVATKSRQPGPRL